MIATKFRNPVSVKVVNAASHANRSARRYGAPGHLTAADIRSSLLGKICHYCNSAATEIDHLIPLSRGGHNTVENIVPSCRSCNATKRNGPPGRWAVDYDACIDCGKTNRRHNAHGLCTACDLRRLYRAKPHLFGRRKNAEG